MVGCPKELKSPYPRSSAKMTMKLIGFIGRDDCIQETKINKKILKTRNRFFIVL